MKIIGKTISFWGNIEYPTNKDAMLARNTKATELKKQGVTFYKSSMPNQLKPYSGLGCPDGRVGTVYTIELEAHLNS